jgi:hypothetical protein
MMIKIWLWVGSVPFKRPADTSNFSLLMASLNSYIQKCSYVLFAT